MSKTVRWCVVLFLCWAARSAVAQSNTTPILSAPFICQWANIQGGCPGNGWSAGVPDSASPADDNCGPTSVLMIASKWNGTTPTADDITQEDDWLQTTVGESWGYLANGGKGSGTEPPELQSLARDYFNLPEATAFSGWTLEQLKQELASGNPVIVRVRPQMVASYPDAHYMVLLGMDQQWVYVNDPGIRKGAQAKYKLQDFIDSWGRTASWNGQKNQGVSIHHPSNGAVQWLAFYEGNPGIPGDGQTINSGPTNYPGIIPAANVYFQPEPPIPLGNLTDGFTLTVFPVGGISFPYSVGFHTLTLAPSAGCPIVGDVSGTTFSTAPLQMYNGVQGIAISVPQSNLSTMVSLNNAYLAKYFPSCPSVSLSDFSLTDIYLTPGGALTTASPPSEIDAIAFAPGQGVVPNGFGEPRLGARRSK